MYPLGKCLILIIFVNVFILVLSCLAHVLSTVARRCFQELLVKVSSHITETDKKAFKKIEKGMGICMSIAKIFKSSETLRTAIKPYPHVPGQTRFVLNAKLARDCLRTYRSLASLSAQSDSERGFCCAQDWKNNIKRFAEYQPDIEFASTILNKIESYSIMVQVRGTS